jgi:hypothetical protein
MPVASSSAGAAYAATLFKYQDLAEELDAIGKAASTLLAPERRFVLTQAVERLTRSRTQSNRFCWHINEPITTIRNGGKHGPTGAGNFDAEGRLTFTWDIRSIRPKRGRDASMFEIDGNISTKMAIYGRPINQENGDDRLLACWRFELGTRNHPGAFVHSQVDWDIAPEAQTLEFDVPRLPSILITPGECLDFLLGELFQADWPKAQQNNANELQRWQARQKKRLINLVSAQQEVLKATTNVSPWIALKRWKPSEAGFLLK